MQKRQCDKVVSKIKMYHLHIQLGLIAQGLMMYLSANHAKHVWHSFGSWIRTIRPGIPPSEFVTSIALKNSLPEFLIDCGEDEKLKKFLGEQLDFEQAKHFTAATEVSSLAITKLDGTAKGGVAIGISDQFQIPIKYIGVGESIEQLQVFNKRAFVDSMFKS